MTEAKVEMRKYLTNHNHFKESLKMEMTKKERYGEKFAHLKQELEEAMKSAHEMCSERIVDLRYNGFIILFIYLPNSLHYSTVAIC